MAARKLYEGDLVHQAFSVICTSDQVAEVRILDAVLGTGGWPATFTGYYNDSNKLVDSLGTIRSAKGIYITVNPVNPALLARSNNRLRKAPKGESTSDTDILFRRWLLIDTDAQRPSGISASDEEHHTALQRAQEVRTYLASLGWPAPLVADSGNGGHLMYRIDLPTNDQSLVQRVLAALAEKFDDDLVHIDTKVFNPARIWKLYGTLACKGDDVKDRPHRLSKILNLPERMEIVSLQQLEQIGKVPSPVLPPVAVPKSLNGSPFDLVEFIARHSLDVDGPHAWHGGQGTGDRWTFRTSPLCSHHEGAAFLLRHSGGAISAGCHHNSCSWKWSDLRQQLEPVDNTPVKSLKNRGIVNVSARQRAPINIDPYAPFPVRALPEMVGNFIQEASTAIGCDASFVALPTLASLARVIGNKRVIRLKETWTEPSILWLSIVGKSGTHKTPALKAATRHLEKIQAEAIEQYRQALPAYEQARAQYEKDLALWKRAKTAQLPWQPEVPSCTRYIVSDITIEALAERLESQFDGVLVVRDELAGWVNGIGEYKGGRGSDNGHWLSSWSGVAMTVDRKSTAQKMIHVPRAAVSLVGGIQPGILRTAIGREHMQDGLCARLLLAMPAPRAVRWTDNIVRPETERAIAQHYDRLLELEPALDSEGRPEPYPISLTPEAKRLWIEYYNQHRQEQVGLDDDLAAAWSKLEAYTARFALIFQLSSWAAGEACQDAIDQKSMESAIQISDWFGGEAKRVYSVMIETEVDREQRELADLVRRKGGVISTRELMRCCRRYPRSEDAEAALNELAKDGLGFWEPLFPGEQGGKPSSQFRIVDTADVDNTF